MHEDNQPRHEKDLHGQMQDSLAFIIGLVVSFFTSPFIIIFTKDFVISFSVAITDGGLDDFTAGFIWGACVYGGVFFATTYFIHIKLTVMGTKMITKQFEPEAAQPNQKKKSGAGTFIEGAFFMFLMLLVLGSLTGCKEQNDHQRTMQADANAAALRIVQENNKHEQSMAEGRGHHAKNEADAQRTQEMTLETMAINAAREARQAFRDLINGTISPLIMWITGIASFCGLAGFGFFRFCTMREKLAEYRVKEAIAVALAATMTPEDLKKAYISESNILNLTAIQ